MGLVILMIKNKKNLTNHGCRKARDICAQIIEHALEAVDPYRATLDALCLIDDVLVVDGTSYDLSKIDNIYVVGAGKATFRQALALDELLKERITQGLVVVKYGQKETLNHIRVLEAAHPVPDANSFKASAEIMAVAEKAGPDDLVFCLMSGGCSSTCASPVHGISAEDKITINHLMVHCGAQVTEIMSVRRHLSRIKGGRLAAIIAPAACITLTVSDAIGDPMEWNTDWTHPDSSTFEGSVNILKKYDLWNKIPPGVKQYFSSFSHEKETPKSFTDYTIQYLMTVKTETLWRAAMEKAQALGLDTRLISTLLKGESREVGRVLTCLAKETLLSGNPAQPPCALISIGETGVRVSGKPKGKGGANQELACGACLDLEPDDPIVIAAIDTDGTDGPTDLAGAMVDGSTLVRAKEKGIDFYRTLMEHDSSFLMESTGDAIITGHTGSNVNDMMICVILPQDE